MCFEGETLTQVYSWPAAKFPTCSGKMSSCRAGGAEKVESIESVGGGLSAVIEGVVKERKSFGGGPWDVDNFQFRHQESLPTSEKKLLAPC